MCHNNLKISLYERDVKGGTVGLILDARGRPLVLPESRQECKQCVGGWVESIELYPQAEPAAAISA